MVECLAARWWWCCSRRFNWFAVVCSLHGNEAGARWESNVRHCEIYIHESELSMSICIYACSVVQASYHSVNKIVGYVNCGCHHLPVAIWLCGGSQTQTSLCWRKFQNKIFHACKVKVISFLCQYLLINRTDCLVSAQTTYSRSYTHVNDGNELSTYMRNFYFFSTFLSSIRIHTWWHANSEYMRNVVNVRCTFMPLK